MMIGIGKMTGTKTNRIAQVRHLLREADDGLTTAQILKMIPEIKGEHLSRILNSMPDSYIDRWENSAGCRWHRAVWCVVIPPPDCPRPERKNIA